MGLEEDIVNENIIEEPTEFVRGVLESGARSESSSAYVNTTSSSELDKASSLSSVKHFL